MLHSAPPLSTFLATSVPPGRKRPFLAREPLRGDPHRLLVQADVRLCHTLNTQSGLTDRLHASPSGHALDAEEPSLKSVRRIRRLCGRAERQRKDDQRNGSQMA